jgi:hypothetical protein
MWATSQMRSAALLIPPVLLTLALTLADARPAACFDLSTHGVPTSKIVSGGPKKDGIPALDRPDFVPAGRADFLDDEDIVVGLDAPEGSNAQPHAYPLAILNWHEIVNDRLGDLSVVVTYCPLTGSAAVFDRGDEDRTMSFGVSGRLYQSNVLIYDRRTESLWSQLSAKAVAGPRTGETLTQLPIVVAPWSAWRAAHPDTLVLSTRTGHQRDYRRDPYAGYESHERRYFPTTHNDGRFHSKEPVVGIVIDGVARAYPVSELERLGPLVTDEISGHELQIRSGPLGVAVFVDEVEIVSTRLYWFAWYAFHPDTTVWPDRQELTTEPAADPNIAKVTEVRSYWTSFGGSGGFMLQPGSDTLETRGGLFVVAGIVQNTSERTLHHVELRFDLLDETGRLVASEQGYNRGAEVLVEVDVPGVAKASPDLVKPIPAGGEDSYRMIFIGDEVPNFSKPRVVIRKSVFQD